MALAIRKLHLALEPHCLYRPGMRPLLLAPLLLAAACAPEGEPQIQVDGAWARPTLGNGQSTAAYLTIRNSGSGSDTLIEVRSEGAERASLHRSANENGVATMRAIEGGVEIGPGQSAVFAPGGNHVMIEKVARPLAPGERIRLVLRFERSGERTLEAAVSHGAGANHAGH